MIGTIPRDRFVEIAVRNPRNAVWESVPGAVVGVSHAREAANEGAIIMANRRGEDGRFRLLVKRAAKSA
ncbi:hypothetical protein [Falsiroseomonas sp. CW058]|uniref:hypothetical protein n=1 Tax=Falsiroseomonas sp. CW058 TaxID=3388664 RepID=UPI003D31AA9F